MRVIPVEFSVGDFAANPINTIKKAIKELEMENGMSFTNEQLNMFYDAYLRYDQDCCSKIEDIINTYRNEGGKLEIAFFKGGINFL